MRDDVRETALQAAHTGAQVLVMMADGEQVVAHVDRLAHGGMHLVVRHPSGRVERFVWYAHVDSMAMFEQEEEPVPDDPLDALTAQLKARAVAGRQKSLAERAIDNFQRQS